MVSKYWAVLQGLEAKIAVEHFGWPGVNRRSPEECVWCRREAEALYVKLYGDARVALDKATMYAS
jgi:hypothetical protein